MTAPVAVTEHDLHSMLRVVDAPDLGDDGVGLPWSTLRGLRMLIPCSAVAFNGIDVDRRKHYFMQDTDEPDTFYDDSDPPGADPVFWAFYLESICSYPERTGDYRSVIKTSDLCTLREFRQTSAYAQLYGPMGCDHFLTINLPDGPGRQLRLIFMRGWGDPDLTERDRALLTLLRPHLHAAHLHVLHRRRGMPQLTQRQWELLRLVDAGLSNRQIARRLQVSDHTVRKHLENAFERLQVNSRTAAVARAFPQRRLT